MTDSIDETLAQAGLNLLRADAGLTVHDGRVPDGAVLPYVLVYTTVSWPATGAGNNLTQARSTAMATWNCHCAGENAAASRMVHQRVRAALLNQTVSVLGRGAAQIKQDDVQAPVRDETTGRLVMDLKATYSAISTP